MGTDGYDIHYLTCIQRTMEAIRDLVSEKAMTIHEIHKELPHLDIDTIRDLMEHLILDFEVADLYIAIKTRYPENYEQVIGQKVLKKVRQSSPLRKSYENKANSKI